MARTITQIEAALEANINQAIPAPSASKFAEWQLWKSIFARAVWAFEMIMDSFRVEIEAKIQQKQPGSFDWYYDKIMEFQGANDGGGNFQGDDLVVKDGVINYEVPDPARRIIAQCSLSAAVSELAVKIAKRLDASNFQPLTASEQIAFGLYLNNVKYPGTKTNVISMEADKILYDLKIYYNPVYTTATVTANIQAKLEEFRQSMGFNDKIYAFKLLNKIAEAEGVVSVKNTSVKGWGVSAGAYVEIDVVYLLESGYFNYDAASVLEFINYKTV
jgi:hypothetical protein